MTGTWTQLHVPEETYYLDSEVRMALYGQITQLYRFGGADVFEPIEGARYPG